MSSLYEELKIVADKVSDALSTDTFPDSVEPESLRSAVRAYPLRGGKRLRPALALWSCGALGGDPFKAFKAGLAVEIYHNWTLVHDDIIDRDDFRRGVPTAHKMLEDHAANSFDMDTTESAAYGRAFAILAGDIQQAWASDMLLRSVEDGVPPSVAVALSRRLCETVNRELISGEALDVEFPYWGRKLPSEDQVLRMMSWKTGTLLKFCLQAGGAIASNSTDFKDEPLKNLGDFAERIGVAFQLIDDYLGVFGESSKFGKPLCSDLREGKPTILFLKTLAGLDERGRNEFESLVGRAKYSERQIEAVRRLMLESGAVAANKELAVKLSEKAKHSLAILPESKWKTLLLDLAGTLLERKS